MDTNKILSASLLDIVFENRNKAYGAYALRNGYSQRITKSILITLSLVVAATVAMSFKSNDTVEDSPNIKDYTLVTLSEKTLPPPILPPAEAKPKEVKQKTVILTTPKLVDNVEDPPPSKDEIDKSAIGNFNSDGPLDDAIATVAAPGDGLGVVKGKEKTEEDIPVSIVEVPAKFNGDWKRFLERNLDPQVPIGNDAPSGRYIVRVKFVVDRNGNVSDIEPQTNLGYGMEQEAVRVLKKATKWEPAIQNGHKVKAYHVQQIVFEISGGD